MSSPTAVEHLVRALREAGVARVYGVTSDLEFWAPTASVDGRVGLNDLTRTLDVIREAGTLESPRPRT
jgi:hypothetical protein